MLDNAVAPGAWLDADPVAFRERFDRETITFRHRLSDHPLFASERIMQLAKYLAAEHPDGLYYDAGDVGIGTRWDAVPKDLPVDVLLERIETAGAWIVLRSAERDPEYARLLEECLDQISEMAGLDMARLVKLKNAIVFINSPHRISSYHIDRECNSLLQIRGTKTVHVFDRRDREVLPETEIERFWAVDNNAPIYKPQFEDRAVRFPLAPGDALHIPVNSPHWVQNGPEVSVSLSINFHYREEILADIYRVNHLIRRIGLTPLPPRVSPAVDQVKRAVWNGGRSARTTLKRITGRG